MADMITVIERERASYHGSRDIKMTDTKMVATNISNIVTNLTDLFGQIVSTLTGLHCLFDIHPYLDSNCIVSSLKLVFQYFS